MISKLLSLIIVFDELVYSVYKRTTRDHPDWLIILEISKGMALPDVMSPNLSLRILNVFCLYLFSRVLGTSTVRNNIPHPRGMCLTFGATYKFNSETPKGIATHLN